MPRFKSHKDYAIKLIHPEFGDFYYGYNNYKTYIFTKNLKRVTKWKTKKVAEEHIDYIINDTKKSSYEYGAHKALLSFGKDIDNDIKDNIPANNLVYSMKRYYCSVNNLCTKDCIEKAKSLHEKQIKEAKKQIEESTLLSDIEFIKQSVIDNKHIEKKFTKNIDKLKKDINEYTKNYNFLKNIDNKKEYIMLEIVDASYGFRRLKLKTLKNVESNE